MDKTAFFQHKLLRSIQSQASEALQSADRIVCMGYSFPRGDRAILEILKTSAARGRVPFEVVDMDPKQIRLAEILGDGVYQFKQWGLDDADCVPRFVVKSCISNQEDKTYVIGMTGWTTRPQKSKTSRDRTVKKAE